eukprot:Skav236345  [mRNA]  locus=scaffold918:73896:76401:- [translate_table: standard]
MQVVESQNRLQQIFKTIVQAREDVGVDFENTRMTALLRIYEVMDLKRQLEATQGKQNKKSLAHHYASVKFCKRSEPVTASFIEVAQMLHGTALKVPAVLRVLTDFDQLASNPMDSVHKVREVVIQADKRVDSMEWAFTMLWDWFHNVDAVEIGIRDLKEGSRYAVSLIKVFLAKKSLREWLWKNMEVSFSWESAVKQQIRELTSTLENVRSNFGFYDRDETQVAYPDRGSWPLSADLYVIIFEALVFGYKHDAIIGQTLKNHRAPDDVPYMDKVKAAYEKETGVETADEVVDEQDSKVVLDSDNVHLSLPEVLLKSASADDDNPEMQSQLEAGIRAAQRRVQGQVQLVVDQDEGLSALLEQTKAMQVRGDVETKSYVAVVFDGKILCESGSQSKYRLPPLRAPQLKRLVQAFLHVRDGSLQEGDVFVAIDGGKGASWEDQVMKAVSSKKLHILRHTALYTFESCESRLERASKQPLEMTETVQPRLYSESNTRGNAIAWLAKPAWSDVGAVWSVSVGQKRAIFGPSNLPLPGGPCPVEHEAEGKPKDSEIVATFWHESPPSLAAEVAHFLNCKAVVDLTPGSGHWALWSVKKRIPYAGIVMTELHKDLLLKRLITKTIEGMLDPNDEDLYDSQYLTLVQKNQPEEDVGTKLPAPKVGPKPRPGPKVVAKSKPAAKDTAPKPKPAPKSKPAAGSDEDKSGDVSRTQLINKITAAARGDEDKE